MFIRTGRLLPIVAGLAAALAGWPAVPAHADTIFVGPSAAYGTAVPAGPGSGNARADTSASLTYLFTSATYTVTATGTITVDSVNFANQSAGSITPFLARYMGGSVSSGTSYDLVVAGDTFSVATGTSQGVLVNHAFTVGGSTPTIAVTAGEVLVAGVYQSSKNVVFASGTTSALIDSGDTIPAAAGLAFPSTSAAFFTFQLYRFDIGLDPESAAVPEPGSLLWFGGAIVGLGLIRRRRA